MGEVLEEQRHDAGDARRHGAIQANLQLGRFVFGPLAGLGGIIE